MPSPIGKCYSHPNSKEIGINPIEKNPKIVKVTINIKIFPESIAPNIKINEITFPKPQIKIVFLY